MNRLFSKVGQGNVHRQYVRPHTGLEFSYESVWASEEHLLSYLVLA
jgi:hypothetical protein